jgi:hypothetical protein
MTPREPAIRLFLASVLLGLLTGSADAAQQRTAPAACDATQRPSAVPAGPLPQVHVWKKSDLPAGWHPPACLPWPSASDAAVVETLGTFASGGDGAALLARLGHVSRLTGLKYWSAADQEWRPLFTQAVALSGPDPDAKRADFAPSELHQGGTYYLLQSDGNPLGPIVQAMTIIEATPTRLVANMRNVSGLGFLGMPLVSEDALQTFFDLARNPDGTWSYYSLARLATHLPGFLEPSEATLENRAVAIFRFVAGYRDDIEPPIARNERP